MSFFIPGESEQIDLIDTMEAESALQAPFASFISQEAMDEFLRQGSNTTDHRMTMVNDFAKQLSTEAIAEHMQHLYHGGNGLQVDGVRYSAWYDKEGIRFARGNNVRYLHSAQLLSWTDAAKRAGELLEAGQFASILELATAPIHERKQLAQSLWYLYRDISDEGNTYFPSLAELHGGGYPEETALLTERLADSSFAQALTQEASDFAEAWKTNPDLMRFRFHNPVAIHLALSELAWSRRSYESLLTEVSPSPAFITEDEINEALAGGSNVAGGKGRIYDAFTKTPSLAAKEKADFLKSEYGIGGHSHAVSGSDHSSESHDGKGIKLEKDGCSPVMLTWAQTAQRIEQLIRQERYLSPEQLEERVNRTEAAALADDVVLSDDDIELDEDDIELEEPDSEPTPTDIRLSAAERLAASRAALQEWNGDIASKHTVSRHIKSLTQDPESSDWLKLEFGENLPASL